MSLLVLMYHRTPKAAADHFDVDIGLFREQVATLQDAGFTFRPFAEADADECYGAEKRVSITFDDGHRSNLAAFEILEGLGIRPTSFVVKDWSQRDTNYVSSKEMYEFSRHCDFGGHGATHTSLTFLSLQQLREELRSSKAFIEDVLGYTVTSMALPGGRFNRLVIEEAKAAGFTLVGNSIPLPNFHAGASINRIVVKQNDGRLGPLRWAKASRLLWEARRARRGAVAIGASILGEARYAALTRAMRRAVN